MANLIKPEVGATIRAHRNGGRRIFEYVVQDTEVPSIPDAVWASRPSRKWPGNYYGRRHVIRLDWIVS